MASLPPNATQDEIEEELEFQEVLIQTLDPEAADYTERLSDLEAIKVDLERRLDTLRKATSPSHTTQYGHQDHGMDMSESRFLDVVLNGPPDGDNTHHGNTVYDGYFSGLQPGMKRSLPQGVASESLHPSKRPTPDPSNVGTPTSSAGSFELVEHPSNEVNETFRQKQHAREAMIKRQHESQRGDEDLARRLSQAHQQPYSSSFASSSRPNVQTTLNYNGSYQRPSPVPKTDPSPLYPSQSLNQNENVPVESSRSHPRPTTIPSPYVKQEIKSDPSFSHQHRLVERPRFPEIVDLTGSDDEDVTEIGPNDFDNINHLAPLRNNFPVQNYTQRQPAPYVQPSMPGAFPTPNQSRYQNVYGNANNMVPSGHNWMAQANPLVASAANGIRNAFGGITDSMSDLSNIIMGTQPRTAMPSFDDSDDEVVYGGSRQLPPGPRPYAGYQDMNLYQERFDRFASYDATKTAEEINALLQNIRPDEDLPAHLRVQTPEAMAINLHKYQEMGLTWLQKSEASTNLGGILADEMGLGKTIQMLSLIVTRKSENPRCKTTLIIAPVALMRQWKQEIEQKIKPGRHKLSVYIQHGPSKRKNWRDLQVYDIVLTTYGTLASELKKLELFHQRQEQNPGVQLQPDQSERCALLSVTENVQWYRVILDEAQCIKNRNTQTWKGAHRLKANYRWCVTGTPMMNNVEELYSLIGFLRIPPYHNWEKFRRTIVQPLKGAYEGHKESAMKTLQALCKAIMLRRTKKSTFEGQPILVLPERTTDVENPVFDDDEKEFYQSIESRTRLTFNRYLKRGQVGQNYSAILVLLLRLRQACCHPHLIKDFGISAAADITEEAVLNFAKELSEPVVERIKATGGNFECPVCYDAVPNPAIYIPCGHDSCRECFSRITDPANAIRDGNENGGAKCPNCRGPVDPKRVTDFESFKKVHMPELLAEGDQLNAEQDGDEEDHDGDDDSDTDSDTSDSEAEDADDVDERGNLAGFVVEDDEAGEDNDEEETQSQAGDDTRDAVGGPSNRKTPKPAKGKKSQVKKAKGKKKSKKGKGKEKEKKKAVTLADLKKLSTRNAKMKKKYLRRLRENYIDSAKIRKTMELLERIINDPEGEKILIFSQWTSLLDLLEVPIDGKGWDYRRYDGSMNSKMRADAVDDFRDHTKDVRIMLVSLKAGNAGLNLNMASQVIILDPFWNPFIEEQAIDRAHRIGQTRPVQVHRILIAETVEDRIIELQEKKRTLINEALDEKAGQSISRLGIRDLAYLFGVTSNPDQAV